MNEKKATRKRKSPSYTFNCNYDFIIVRARFRTFNGDAKQLDSTEAAATGFHQSAHAEKLQNRKIFVRHLNDKVSEYVQTRNFVAIVMFHTKKREEHFIFLKLLLRFFHLFFSLTILSYSNHIKMTKGIHCVRPTLCFSLSPFLFHLVYTKYSASAWARTCIERKKEKETQCFYTHFSSCQRSNNSFRSMHKYHLIASCRLFEAERYLKAAAHTNAHLYFFFS